MPIQLTPPPKVWVAPEWWAALPAWLQSGVLVYVHAAGYTTPEP